MIHVFVTYPGINEDPKIQVTLTGLQDLRKFQAFLNRALNVAPEFGEDWFKLCDKLTEYLERVSPPT